MYGQFCSNYNLINTSDGSCEIIEGTCDVCEDGVILDNDEDDDGVCNSDGIGVLMLWLVTMMQSTTDTDNSLCNYSTDIDGVQLLEKQMEPELLWTMIR